MHTSECYCDSATTFHTMYGQEKKRSKSSSDVKKKGGVVIFLQCFSFDQSNIMHVAS